MGERKFIPVDGANDISDGIDIAIGKNAGGMRTFVGKGIQLIIMFADTNGFPVTFCNGNAILSKDEERNIVGDHDPL